MDAPPLLPGPIDTVYQPIVDLRDRSIVGYEALTRPASGGSPEELFAEAERRGVTAEFDWLCRVSAVRGAVAAGLPTELALFVNSEPAALDAPAPDFALAALADAAEQSIVVEITERDLMADPAGVLSAVSHARDLGWRIAVDDVGADSSSLALLALLRPDVVKLEMRLIQQPPTPETIALLAAVAAETARTGSVIVAEGIENAAHEARALELGASWGQGWYFGVPGPLPRFDAARRRPHRGLAGPALTVRAPVAVTPFGLTHGRGAATRTTPAALNDVEEDLLRRALACGPASLVLATVPQPETMTEAVRRLLDQVAERSALTVLFTAGDPRSLAGRHRVVVIGPGEPLAREHSVVVVDPAFTAALTAVPCTADGAPCVEYRLTHDRDQVLDAATLLLHRVPPR
ncbi:MULTISPECIES: EAL domain-containing protein [unclassified Rhodococcus (in: high G+C Gram-positive bacteria)]|uniref:EAL domain-containing protein n=1 Tax=unclassified Rhodococcus (in: high G+C Gram-positive bacteria) TaxID=192944 RepID=UPI0027E14DBE|nr:MULTISPECIES: EAL domain-containing protein [unclassified Rhodococcus (in: high G+C Gram-positive bacteria)]